MMSFSCFLIQLSFTLGFPAGSHSKESACSVGDLRSIPGLGRSPGGGHNNPLYYPCLENPLGPRRLAIYSSGGCKVSDTTEQLVCVCVCEMCSRRFSFLKYFQFRWPGVFSNLYRIIGIRCLILQLVNAKENRNGLSSRRYLTIELMYFSLPFKSTSHLMGIVLFFVFFFYYFSLIMRLASDAP